MDVLREFLGEPFDAYMSLTWVCSKAAPIAPEGVTVMPLATPAVNVQSHNSRPLKLLAKDDAVTLVLPPSFHMPHCERDVKDAQVLRENANNRI